MVALAAGGKTPPAAVAWCMRVQSNFGSVAMSVLAWIVLGLIAGFLGSKLVNKSGEGFFLDILLGVVGAVVGGYLFQVFGAHGVTGLNLYSLVVSVVGAVVVLVVYHAVFGRSSA
jgi:uncharacterized membrane protein YeaQ/YmgE (transglycosylase-associated protein family)